MDYLDEGEEGEDRRGCSTVAQFQKLFKNDIKIYRALCMLGRKSLLKQVCLVYYMCNKDIVPILYFPS